MKAGNAIYRRSRAGLAVDLLADNIGVPGMTGGLLNDREPPSSLLIDGGTLFDHYLIGFDGT